MDFSFRCLTGRHTVTRRSCPVSLCVFVRRQVIRLADKQNLKIGAAGTTRFRGEDQPIA
jgi:hypothetical protein